MADLNVRLVAAPDEDVRVLVGALEAELAASAIATSLFYEIPLA